jgi:hypothetical protein
MTNKYVESQTQEAHIYNPSYWEAAITSILFKCQPRQIVCKTLTWKYPTKKLLVEWLKWYSSCPSGGAEFRPQYWQKLHDELYNILKYKRNENDIEILFHASQNDYHHEHKQQ